MAYPGNTARASFKFVLPNGTAGYCTPHFRTLDGSDASDADVDLLASLLADWSTAANFQSETNVYMMQYASEDLVLESITVTSLATPVGYQKVQPVVVAGGHAETPLPNESAIVTTLYTGLTGRANRGRNFWPIGIGSYIDEGGVLNSGVTANLQTTFNALIAGLEDEGTWVAAVNSPSTPGVNQVTSCIVRRTVHHQRRRNAA